MLTRDDLDVLADLVSLDPEFRAAPDDQLLTMIWHEVLHEFEQGRRVLAAADGLLLRRMFIDPRVVRHALDSTRELLGPVWPVPAEFDDEGAVQPASAHLTLAGRLERGASADVWYDHDTFGDDVGADGLPISARVSDAQEAMMEAARLLREHGLDR